jgi:prephenate dehydrogenase
MQSVVEEQADTLNVSPGSFAPETSVKKVSPQQDHYNRINNYLRDNNVDAAYAEFKRSEKQLKDAMTKSEFKQLKNMVENAYKIRHPGK